MGVYINIEMPKCCAECDAEGHYENSYGDEYGFFCPFGYKAYTEETRDAKRLDSCPLVTLPPHGRLIDADALIEDLKYDVELDAVALDSMEIVGDERRKIQDDKDFKQNCIFWIENAPTVIEAEEE